MRFFIIEKKEIYNQLNDRSKLRNKIAINARINTQLPQLKKGSVVPLIQSWCFCKTDTNMTKEGRFSKLSFSHTALMK